MAMSAQTKITFENQALNGASVMYNGTATVVANPATTGINTSAYCLDVVDNGYAPVKLSNFQISTGSKTTYAFVKLKFKIAYKSINGASPASDVNYPSIDVYSSAGGSSLVDASEKLGSIGSAWGTPITTPTTDSLVWKNAEFTFSASALATIPNGTLILKLAKNKCEYLIDDIEVIPSPVYGSNILSCFNFESSTIGEAYTTANVYGGTVASTAIVAADPAATSTNALKMTSTAYNQVISLSITLPIGKLLTDYDRLYFDRYSTAVQYTQAKIMANTTTIYADASGYPSQGAAATWVTKDYELSSSVTASNAFTLFIGYAINNDAYYIDNVKLHLRDITTGTKTTEVNPLIVYCAGNTIKISDVASQIDVYNVEGRLLVSAKNTSVINVSNLGKGIYIVKAQVNGQTFNSKVSK